MICPYCKQKLPDHARFCARCGNVLQEPQLTNIELTSDVSAISTQETKKNDNSRKKRKLGLGLVILTVVLIAVSAIFWKDSPLKGLETTMESLEGKFAKEASEMISLSESDKNIVGDEQHIFFVSENNAGTIYRLNKKTYEISLMCEPYVSPGEVEGEYLQLNPNAITLCENDLYFSLKSSRDGYATAYYRMPKEGGEAEFLFLLPESYMETDGEKIYFLCRNTKQVGIYDPKKGGLPTFMEVMDTPTSAKGRKPMFSVSGKNLYYLGVPDGESGKQLYQMDLETGKSEVVGGIIKEESQSVYGAFFKEPYLYYSTDFFGDIYLVREYNMDTGENKILAGVKGYDLFLSTYKGKLLVPNQEPGIYLSLDLEDLSKREEVYRGKEYTTDNSIENSINAMLGKPTEEVKTIIERTELSQQYEGYLLTNYEGRDLSTGTDFSWSSNIESYTPLTVLAQQEGVKEGVKWMVTCKEEDFSNGVAPLENNDL